MKRYLIALLALTLLGSAAGLSQTAGDLQKKYGPPDASGRYTVRPGIGLTVRPDESGNAREVTIKPIDSSADATGRASKKAPVMNPGVAREVLDEVAPASKRGQYEGAGNAEFGCASVDHLRYENVLISISNRCHQQGGGTYSINIRWKR
jgi:hypothetical protein